MHSSDGQTASVLPRMAVRPPLIYELIPVSSVDDAIEHLPDGAQVSLTCSPTKGIPATLGLADRVRDAGHRVIPHLAARTVADRAEVRELASWFRRTGTTEAFVIAGDAPRAAGRYEGAIGFIHDLLEAEPGLQRVGVAGYPEGHPLFGTAEADEYLAAKAELLSAAGVDAWVSSQMCFDPRVLAAWIDRLEGIGVDLPLHLGISGVIDRTRLVSMGVRLGVGASLRFARKQRGVVRLVARPHDPTEFVEAVLAGPRGDRVEALHAFTFNAVRETRAWHDEYICGAGARSRPRSRARLRGGRG